MSTSDTVVNPFAMMTCPETIFAALEYSDRLSRLHSRICRPLDKPRATGPVEELTAFDAAIESAGDSAVD